MNDKDLIYRFMFENISVRGEWVRLDQSYRTIVLQHKYPVLIQKLIGELLVVTCLLTAIVKFKGNFTVQFQGKSKLKLLLAQCDQQFHLRALAQWLEDIKPEELSDLMQEGVMVITVESSAQGQRYQGIVAWEGGSISSSIEGYFKNSEQLPTRLWVTVNEANATGLLLQILPRDGSKAQHGDDDWDRLIYLTDTVTEEELSSLDPVTLCRRLYAEEDVRIFPPARVSFQCKCSIEKSENALLILGRKEVDQELMTKQVIVVTCEFCSKAYSFDNVDVAKIFTKNDKPPTSSSMH